MRSHFNFQNFILFECFKESQVVDLKFMIYEPDIFSLPFIIITSYLYRNGSFVGYKQINY